MTEERKVQLGFTARDEVTPTLEKIGQGTQKLAQVMTQAGQTAGKALDGVADGAKRAADGFTREEGRMRASIQRATLELQTLGKSASQKLEAKIDFQGLDPAKFAPFLASLREAEAATARAQASAKGASFLGDVQGQIAALREQAQLQSLTTDEALRYKAAQLGVSQEASHLITQLTNMRAAQEAVAQAARDQAAAQREAATVAATKSSFLAGLQQQVGAIGKSRADLLELRAAELGVAEAAAPMIAKLREADQTQKGFTANGKLNAFQLQQLGFQLHDFGVQVLSGQNALTAFVQQGSQLSGTFGGAGNAFRAVLSVLTPMRLAMLGAAAGVGALALAMASAETKARELATVQAQLAGTGRAGQFSDSGLRDFIRELSLAPGVTRDAATGIVSELSKVHDIGGSLFKDLGRIAADYAKATGTDIPTATKTLAQAFADPAKGAKTLDDALGQLTSSQLLAIERLDRTGDRIGAQKLLHESLEQAIKGLNDRAATPLQKSLSDLGNAWEKASEQFRNSDGLRNLNALLGKTIELVAWLIEHGPSLANIGNAILNTIPGGAVISAAAEVAGRSSSTTEQQATKTGDFARSDRARENQASDDVIKRGLDVAKSHLSEAGQIRNLTQERTGLNKALAESNRLYGVNSEQSRQLRDGIAGINKQISGLGKGQGILDARLQADIKAAQDALQRERDTLAFNEKFLQGQYQAGQVSLVDFYEKKRQAIEAGTTAEIAALEAERKAVEAHLAKSREPDKKEQDRTRLKEIDLQEANVRTRGSRDIILANQEQDASFRQLNDGLLNYRANLLQLAGDEAGAARLRNQIADQQDKIFQAQTKGRPGALTDSDLSRARAEREQQVALTEAKRQTSLINQRLQIEEERIALAQQTGALGEIDALKQEGAAREQAVAKMQEQLAILERLSQERPQDLQLKVDVEGFRLQVDKLKASLDPLKEKFDTIFKDAGANLFSDLMNGTKAKDILRNFASNITKPINDLVAKQLSQQLFGTGGSFGGVGGFFADLFGGKVRPGSPAAAAISNTPQEAFRLSEITAENGAGAASQAATVASQTAAITAQTTAIATETAAVTSATASITALAAAAQSAAAALASVTATGGASSGAGLAGLFGAGAANDFAFGSTTYADAFAGGLIPLASGGYTGHRDEQKVAGVVHGQEYVISAPAVRAIGLQRLERMHQMAKTGRMTEDQLPGYSDGGYVTVQGISRPTEWQSGGQHLMPGEMKAGDSHVTNHYNTYPVTVQATPQTSRATAFQTGREVGRGIDAARARNGR